MASVRTSLLVLAAAMALTGCSRSRHALTGTTALWERQLGMDAASLAAARPAGRRIADEGPKCMKDRLTPAGIREEVQALERARSDKPVAGTWNGRRLSDFPAPQAQFLARYGDFIASRGVSLAGCPDVPCMLNRVYGGTSSTDRTEGWKIYGTYLKSGYAISTLDKLPKQAVPDGDGTYQYHDFPSASPSDFLFSDSELLGFWKLSRILPSRYLAMRDLSRIHKAPLPRSLDLDEKTCGLYMPGGSGGGMIVLRRCLDEARTSHVIWSSDDRSAPDNGLQGIFYIVALHEMSHAIDSSQGSPGTLSQPSLSDEWKAFSGWRFDTLKLSRAEYKKKFGQECTHVVEAQMCQYAGWDTDEDKEGFVREYAGTSPNEDYAETAAYVRVRPRLARAKAPKKAAYLSKKLYDGRTYDDEGLTAYYQQFTVRAVQPQVIELVQGCLLDPPPAGDDATGLAEGVPRLTFARPLPKAVVSCIESRLDARVTAALDQLRADEWEACDHLASNEAGIRDWAFASLNSQVSRYVSENIDRAPLIKAVGQLRIALARELDAREAFLHCHRQAQPEPCYAQAMGDGFDRVASGYAQALGDSLREERDTFLSATTYSQAQARAFQFYRAVFAGVEPRIASVAEERWAACMKAGARRPEPETLLVAPFTGGAQFVSAELLNCVNSAIGEDIKSERDAYLGRFGLGLKDADVDALVLDQLQPVYLEALRDNLADATATEARERQRRKPGVVEVLRSELSTQLDWLGDAQSLASAQSRCEPAALSGWDRYFARVSPDQQLPSRFGSVADLRVEWSREACAAAVKGAAVTRVIEERATRAWNASMTVLETLVTARARDKAVDCRARAKVLALRRRLCMTDGWSKIEKQALVDWDQTPEGKSQSSKRAYAPGYLESQRVRLQEAAIKAMEAARK